MELDGAEAGSVGALHGAAPYLQGEHLPGSGSMPRKIKFWNLARFLKR